MSETKTKIGKLYIEAVGRRKTSTARVRILKEGSSGITVNNKKLKDYFVTRELQHLIDSNMKNVNVPTDFSISVHVKGGGIHSQAEALIHGLARALAKKEPATFKSPVKKLGLLTRDARMKERRKFGLKKARKAPQWSKR